MIKRRVIGAILVFISTILLLSNKFYFNINGAVIGTDIRFPTILTFVLFFGGLLFLSSLEKKILAGLLVAGIAVGGHHILKPHQNYGQESIENYLNYKWEGKRTAPKQNETCVDKQYQTLQYTKNIPAIIVESFFGSNERDLKYFRVKKNRENFCNHVAKGIEDYARSDPKIKYITIAGGHGENDPGAVYDANKKIYEAEFNKEMGKSIAEKLKKKGFNVQYLWYTGKGGQKGRLDYYTKMANKYSGKSLYVEIHGDAAKPSVSGSRVYGPMPKKQNPKSHKLGKTVLNEINKSW